MPFSHAISTLHQQPSCCTPPLSTICLLLHFARLPTAAANSSHTSPSAPSSSFIRFFLQRRCQTSHQSPPFNPAAFHPPLFPLTTTQQPSCITAYPLPHRATATASCRPPTSQHPSPAEFSSQLLIHLHHSSLPPNHSITANFVAQLQLLPPTTTTTQLARPTPVFPIHPFIPTSSNCPCSALHHQATTFTIVPSQPPQSSFLVSPSRCFHFVNSLQPRCPPAAFNPRIFIPLRTISITANSFFISP